eukprot:1255301-Pyramimonas_sp.AAC.1
MCGQGPLGPIASRRLPRGCRRVVVFDLLALCAKAHSGAWRPCPMEYIAISAEQSADNTGADTPCTTLPRPPSCTPSLFTSLWHTRVLARHCAAS